MSQIQPMHLSSNRQSDTRQQSDEFTLGTVRKSSTQSGSKWNTKRSSKAQHKAEAEFKVIYSYKATNNST